MTKTMRYTPLIVLGGVIVGYANEPIPCSPLDFAEVLGFSFFSCVAPVAGGMIKLSCKDRGNSWKHHLSHHHHNPLERGGLKYS